MSFISIKELCHIDIAPLLFSDCSFFYFYSGLKNGYHENSISSTGQLLLIHFLFRYQFCPTKLDRLF